jgi:pyruvate dehydrogenase E2 component (dihydrolipoamide acetyltransferase)
MDILMPQLGETVAEGKVTKWFKSAGDKVAPGDNLFEIETDKTSMEVPATSAGVLAEIRVREGETVPVGAVVAVVSDGSGAATASAPAASAKAPAPPPAAPPKAAAPAAAPAAKPQPAQPSAAAPAPAGAQRNFAYENLDPFFEVRTPSRNYGRSRLPGGTYVTPLARRLAAEAGIDLGGISPSGPNGRIVARDIQKLAGTRPAPAPMTAPAAMPAGASAERVKALYAAGSYEEVPLDGMRRTIAARLTEAKQTIPHFYLSAGVAIDRLMAVREDLNAAQGKDGAKLSINDFVIKALALALQRVPAANAVWAEDRILRFRASDIGVAVAIEGGLITPVIRDAERKSVMDISAEMKDLAGRARAKKLKPQDYQGGTSAISNLGMYGVREFSAIINPPQSTILAVGAGERRAVEAADGSVRFQNEMTVTMSCDHRVVDGALGAELLKAFKLFVEHPVGMMI